MSGELAARERHRSFERLTAAERMIEIDRQQGWTPARIADAIERGAQRRGDLDLDVAVEQMHRVLADRRPFAAMIETIAVPTLGDRAVRLFGHRHDRERAVIRHARS